MMHRIINAIKGERVKVYVKGQCMWIGKLYYRQGLCIIMLDNVSTQVTFEESEIVNIVCWSALLPEIHLNRV